MDLLLPDYVLDFTCIGGDCPDSCCTGWDIDIDKKTFKAYKKLKIDDPLYRNRECSSKDIDYGRIAVDREHRCPFLNHKNLCRIYEQYGEQALSNICYSFPRIYNSLNKRFELSLHMSCPEAARLLVQHEKPLSFREVTINPEKYVIYDFIRKDFELFEKRTDAIRILQNRNIPIKDRLLQLGAFYLSKEGSDEIRPGPEARVEFFQYYLESQGQSAESVDQILAGNANAFLEAYSYAFENYLVNSVFQENFPSEGFLMLVFDYSIIQFLLLERAFGKRALELEDLQEIIQIHSKEFKRHRSLSMNLLYEIQRKGLDTLEYVSLLFD